MTPRDQDAEGYTAPIYRGIWERMLTMGAPRVWSAAWVVGCLYLGLICLTLLGFRWVLLPVVLWVLGQGILIVLTTWDRYWDEVLLAQLTRRYKGFYDRG